MQAVTIIFTFNAPSSVTCQLATNNSTRGLTIAINITCTCTYNPLLIKINGSIYRSHGTSIQWRRKEIIVGGGGGGRAKGDAPGRLREGGTPPAQLGGMGERCELPHRGLGRSPRSQRFLRLKNSKNYTKTWRPRKRPRPLFYVYTKPPTKKNGSCLNERIAVIINASALSVSTFLERNFALTERRAGLRQYARSNHR